MNKEGTQDFLRKSFIMLVLAYLLLFGLETILPGLVMDIFNINHLLFAILAILFVFLFSKTKLPKPGSKKNKKFLWFFFPALIFLSGVLVIALFRASLIESFFYLFLVLIISRLIWTNIK